MRFIGSILAASACLVFATEVRAADIPDSTISELGAPPADYTPPVEDGPHDLAALYPPDARRRKEEGHVFIVFTVRKDGSVAEASVMRSSGFADLDHAALEAVKTWRYKPARANGQAIEVRWRTYVDFQLTVPVPPTITPPRTDGPPHNAMTFYPETARHLHEQGMVTVKFTVTVDGSVTDPSVVRSSGFADLDDAALEAVKTWRYKPALSDGKPFATRLEANVRFQFSDENNPPPGITFNIEDMKAADYPPAALAAKEEGQVDLSVAVAEDGSVIDVTIANSSGSQTLDDASVELAKSRWHFTPGTLNGKPVKTVVLLVINWALPALH